MATFFLCPILFDLLPLRRGMFQNWYVFVTRFVFMGGMVSWGCISAATFPALHYADQKSLSFRVFSMIHAFDIGGSKIAAGIASHSASLSDLSSIATPTEDYDAFLSAIAETAHVQATAISISIAGLVNPNAGTVFAANIPCLANQSVAKDLAARIGKPVYLINDANAFGLAEAHVGVGKGHRIVFAVILGTGIGGALVLDGKIFTGMSGMAGEWGHGPASTMRSGIALPSMQCGCGQMGCVDLFGGARGLERLHKAFTGNDLTSHEILAAWKAGQTEVSQTLDAYLDVVGGALANMVNVIDPSIIPLGGGLAKDPILVAALCEEVRRRRLPSDTMLNLEPASVGADGGLIGAAVHGFTMLEALS